MEITEIEKLKEFIYPYGKYSNIRSNRQNIKNNFPDLYNKIKGDYKNNLSLILHNLGEIPKCSNGICQNHVKLKNIHEGFRKFCSNRCLNESLKNNKAFSSSIKSSLKLHSENLFYMKYEINGVFRNNYIELNNYCKHENPKIYRTVFNKLIKNNSILCDKCNNEFIDSFIPGDENILGSKSVLKKLKDEKFLVSEKNIRRYHPKLYKCIKSYSKKYKDTSWIEEIYMFENNLSDRPKCPYCHSKKVKPNNYLFFNYKNHCQSPECKILDKKISLPQKEIYNFIREIYNGQIELNKKIENIEIDIFIPEFNLAIEYNGFYWHSTKVRKNPKYHYNKWLELKKSGIFLFNIWEDDWIKRKEIVKSIIKNKLKLIPIKIYARKCQIKNLTSKESGDFFKLNHIQNKNNSSIRLGLYHNEELVSAMTFGKLRKILNSIDKKDSYEIIRFCNKLETSVIGGASKLFNFFINNYFPNEIISYSSCDYSDGKLYKILGFKEIGHTGINYWWCKNGEKFHRSKFSKYKLISRGFDSTKTENEIMESESYYKIYGTGNLKWIYNIEYIK